MGGSGFLLGTNVVVELLKGTPAAIALYESRLAGQAMSVSQVTRIERLSYPDIQPDEEQRVRAFLDRVDVLLLSEDVESATVSIRRQLRLRLPDAVITATAACHGLTLVTRDDTLVRKAVAVVPVLSP